MERTAVDVGILVSDMERMLAFYHGVLELPIVAKGQTSLIGKGDLVALEYGNSRIKLIHLENQPEQKNGRGLTVQNGIRYLTLIVPNIEAQIANLKANQAPIPIDITMLGNGAQIAMVEDPEGNIVEFVQEPSKS